MFISNRIIPIVTQCDAQCPDDSSSARQICGSDGETYASECHLRQFACRYQKDVVVDALGPCIIPGMDKIVPVRNNFSLHLAKFVLKPIAVRCYMLKMMFCSEIIQYHIQVRGF